MENFSTLGLPATLMQSLESMEFHTPTPIQAQAIPPGLEGRDVLGSAQTGTGKTGAFGIPLIAHLMENTKGCALVMTPTRELAVQVMHMLSQLAGGKKSRIPSALLIGGEAMPGQLQQLRNRPRLIVGTPGRINDHLRRGTLMLGSAGFLVLDETDRMMDMGFTEQIDTIMKFLPAKRQTLLFSATLPHHIIKMSERYLNDPVRVAVDGASTPAKAIKHEMIEVSQEGKHQRLSDELNEREGSVIVFVKTKWGADKLATRLRSEGHKADAIHGDLRHNKRERVINSFRNKRYRILVATDIAARGLDIPHIAHVINFDLPQCAEDYIHRIGRTARAGAEGEAICFVAPHDRRQWQLIDRLMDPDAERHKNARPAGSGKGKPSGNRRGRPGGGKPYGKRDDARGGSGRHQDGNKKPFRAKGKPQGKSDGGASSGQNRRSAGGDKPYQRKQA